MGNFFTDAIKPNANFGSIKRVADMKLLEPITRQKVEAIIEDAGAHGLQSMVFETFRSQARQKQFFDQGATRLKKVGVHNYGLACDIVKVVGGEPSWKGSFALLGDLAHHHGLIWGGDWGRLIVVILLLMPFMCNGVP